MAPANQISAYTPLSAAMSAHLMQMPRDALVSLFKQATALKTMLELLQLHEQQVMSAALRSCTLSLTSCSLRMPRMLKERWSTERCRLPTKQITTKSKRSHRS